MLIKKNADFSYDNIYSDVANFYMRLQIICYKYIFSKLKFKISQ